MLVTVARQTIFSKSNLMKYQSNDRGKDPDSCITQLSNLTGQKLACGAFEDSNLSLAG